MEPKEAPQLCVEGCRAEGGHGRQAWDRSSQGSTSQTVEKSQTAQRKVAHSNRDRLQGKRP
jgi:hypothetical protein